MGSTIASPVGASTPAAAAGIQGHFRLQRPGSSPSEREGFTLDVHFDLPGTGVSGIFGPSGSGKTTLLRCIAGLENAPGAHLQVNGRVWQDGKRSLPPHRRPLGFVFQQPSLFPHLNVQENLNFARRRANSATSASEYAEVLELMGIHHLLQRQPQQLSGGEQQRVAIARALLIRPSLLLMDEPMASLDVARKQEVLPYLQAMATTLELPILYVSHAVDEVARLTDQLLILEHGRVARAGKTTELMSRADFPAATADEIGVLLPATIQHRDSNWQLARADIPGGAIWIRDQGEAIGSPIRLRIQARDVSITRGATDQSSMLNRLPVTVGEIRPDRDPAMALVQLITGGDRSQACTLLARITQRSLYQLQLTTGESVWAQIKSVAIAR